MKVTLLFPMAGQGARFGYAFKPFLRVGPQAFIEAAVEPFLRQRPPIGTIVFAYLQEQEQAYQVSAGLESLLPGVEFRCVRLPQPTKGPAETAARAVDQAGLEGPILICDCDHALGIDPLLSEIAARDAACILPTWDLAGEDIKSWGVALVDDSGRVRAIGEKQVPEGEGRPWGVIGCYYFADARLLTRLWREFDYVYMSDLVRHLIRSGATVRAVPLREALFFGDPARLEKAVEAKS
jgi:hypothetical protein